MSRLDRLGIFGPFMHAYGRADRITRLAVDHAGEAYREGLLAPDAYVARICGLLGIAHP